MDRVLVTGAAGFIGSFLAERLCQENQIVIGIDNFFRGKEDNIACLKTNCRFHFQKADIVRDEGALNEIFQNRIDAVYHFAAVNGTEHFYESPLEVLRVNSEGTINLLKLSVKYGIKKFIYASSSEVYGEPRYLPVDEGHPLVLRDIDNPRHTYAASKIIGEYYAKWYGQSHGFKYVLLRIFNTYGPRMDTSKYGQVIPEFIRKMLFEPDFTIIGSGGQTRSFCYIHDAIEMITRAASRVENEVLNIGNDQEVSMAELGKILHQLAGQEYHFRALPPRPGDVEHRVPDISKAKDLLSYTPRFNLRSGLQQTLGWYREQWQKDLQSSKLRASKQIHAG